MVNKVLKQWNCLPWDIKSLSRIRIPRCLFNLKDHKVVSYQLNGLSNASKKAFAAVVYLCVEYKCMLSDIRLVASKTRVAPVKKQSILWLELLGATILVRLMERIVTGLDSPQWENYY